LEGPTATACRLIRRHRVLGTPGGAARDRSSGHQFAVPAGAWYHWAGFSSPQPRYL